MVFMCYRYSVPGPDLLKKTFQASFNFKWERKFHIGGFDFPKAPIITNNNPDKIKLFNWGLIPFWIKDEKSAKDIRQRTANARSETIFEKPAYRSAAIRNHCLVLADGFFEWRWIGGKSFPYYIHLRDHKPFAMAGLWENWKNPIDNKDVFTYTIITCDANALMAKIHNKRQRMPVIFNKTNWVKWIDKDISKEESLTLLKPYNGNDLEAYTISKLITKKDININVPDVLKPFNYPILKSFEQRGLF